MLCVNREFCFKRKRVVYGFAIALVSDRARLHTYVTVPAVFAVFKVAFHLSTGLKYIQLSKAHGMNLCMELAFFSYVPVQAFCNVGLSTVFSIFSELRKNYSLVFHIAQSDIWTFEKRPKVFYWQSKDSFLKRFLRTFWYLEVSFCYSIFLLLPCYQFNC